MRRNRVFPQKNVSLIVGDLGERDAVPSQADKNIRDGPIHG